MRDEGLAQLTMNIMYELLLAAINYGSNLLELSTSTHDLFP